MAIRIITQPIIREITTTIIPVWVDLVGFSTNVRLNVLTRDRVLERLEVNHGLPGLETVVDIWNGLVGGNDCIRADVGELNINIILTVAHVTRVQEGDRKPNSHPSALKICGIDP